MSARPLQRGLRGTRTGGGRRRPALRSLWAEGWRVQRSHFPLVVVVLQPWPPPWPQRNLLGVGALGFAVPRGPVGGGGGRSAAPGPWGWGCESSPMTSGEVMGAWLSALQGEGGGGLVRVGFILPLELNRFPVRVRRLLRGCGSQSVWLSECGVWTSSTRGLWEGQIPTPTPDILNLRPWGRVQNVHLWSVLRRPCWPRDRSGRPTG